MEPNEPTIDKAPETPEDQGVQLGDATPLESEPESPSAEDQPVVDESVLSIEERNIRNSPNIAAPTTGPSEEEIAEKKHEEEMAKLDELKPLVNETLIDNGASMERKKRRPLVIVFIIVFIAVIAGIAGVMYFTNQEKPTKEIKAPVIHYTEEVKVGVDKRVNSAFENVAKSISNFEKITSSTPENNSFSTSLLSSGTYDLLITKDYYSGVVDPGEDPTYEQLKYEPFVNDAIVLIVNKDLPLTTISHATAAQVFAGEIVNWNDIEGIEFGEENTDEHPITQYVPQDAELWAEVKSQIAFESYQIQKGTAADSVADAVSNVADDIGGIAFVRRSDLTTEMLNSVKLLEVDQVSPSNDTISDSSYPYTINYYIISLKTLGADSVPAAYRDALVEHASNASGFQKAILPKADCCVESCDGGEIYDEDANDCVKAVDQ